MCRTEWFSTLSTGLSTSFRICAGCFLSNYGNWPKKFVSFQHTPRFRCFRRHSGRFSRVPRSARAPPGNPQAELTRLCNLLLPLFHHPRPASPQPVETPPRPGCPQAQKSYHNHPAPADPRAGAMAADSQGTSFASHSGQSRSARITRRLRAGVSRS